jgi:thiamine-phosphate pyrophosphorylase
MTEFPMKGLYAITDTTLAAASSLLHQAEQALLGGAAVIQYRDKNGDPAERRREAGELLSLCRNHGVPLLINDDVALAAEISADGVHLGQEDLDLATARKQLGPEAIIGISCYNRLALALQAQQDGADYVAFGRFFSSGTKPLAVQADIDLLQQARSRLHIPIVAIGGITPENGGPLIHAGADMLAVVHGIFGQPDIPSACAQFNRLFQPKGGFTV